MKTYLDCIPCFVKQALDTCRFITDDESVHEHLLREVLAAVKNMDMHKSPPAMAMQVHRMIRKLAGQADPYAEYKKQTNALALEMRDELREKVLASDNPLKTAAQIAIAGNMIDCGIDGRIEHEDIDKALDESLNTPLNGDLDALAAEAEAAESILYLADNAGEIVLDRLLIEQLPYNKITVAVRGGPIINDATTEDAQAAGLQELVKIIDNGSDAPGTILEECSEEFREAFDKADMVIAKGQGNYETLNLVRKNIFFLLKAKCPVVANFLKVPIGSLMVVKSKFE